MTLIKPQEKKQENEGSDFERSKDQDVKLESSFGRIQIISFKITKRKRMKTKMTMKRRKDKNDAHKQKNSHS